MKSVLPTEIPAEIKERALRMDDRKRGGKTVRISFIGDVAGEPVISSLIRKFQVDVNIIHANLDYIKNTPFGSLIIDLMGESSKIEAAMEFLKDRGLKLEVLNGVEPTA